jgi:putative glycosyltransferase
MLRPNREDCHVRLSIVTTLYKSARTIDEFYRRVMAAADQLGYEAELIMVNDGSPDASLDRALAIRHADPRATVIDLSRNFGHHKAMMTGLAYATGDFVFLIDSDLDEEPELLSSFHRRLTEGDCDVVYGFQDGRRGDPIEKLTGWLYYRLLDALSDDDIPRNLVTARLMKKDYVRALVRHRDREFLISQLWSSSGFKQVGLPVKKLTGSKSTYPLSLRARYFVKHLTTSSTRLLYLVFYAGLMLSGTDLAVIFYFLFRYATAGIGISGYTSLIVSIWFFGGLTILILGVQGIYIANVLTESKRRPYTVVREVHKAESRQ